MLKLTELQVSSRNHPIGLDEQPVFSWKMVSDIPDTIQTAYRVRVGSWDTGRVESGDSLFVPYAGPALQPRTAYRVQVEVWDNHGQTACAETGVETGLRGPDGFAAQWIADPFEGEHPLPVFETEFAIDTPVTTARLYITAHGIYEAELDGAKLGEAWFAPGWTSYHKRLQYQTIHVDTARLTPGRHTLRVTVANGWYKGALGFVPSPNHYGDRAALLAMLCLDGRTVATGEGWRVTTGPVQRAEFYYGEDYDAAAPAAAAARTGQEKPDRAGGRAGALRADVAGGEGFSGPQRGMGAGFRPEHHRRGACQTRSASGGAGAPAPC